MTKNTGWLYAAEALPRLASLILVPIWSARVAPAEFARWILALTSVELLLVVGGLGLETFLTKVLYRFHDDRAPRYFGMGATVVLMATAALAALMAAWSPWLSRAFIGGDVRQDLFAWLGVYVLCGQVTNLAILYLEARLQYGPYFVLSTLRWVFNAGLLLFFLLVQRQGFYSWVWAALGTEVLLLPLTTYHLRVLRWGWWRRRMLTFAVRFSVPSLATNLLASGQSRIGRYILSFSGFGSGLGLYGVAQKFAQNYGAAVRPTKIVALRILGHALEEDADSPSFLKFFHVFACLALCAAFLVALFLGDFIKLVVAPMYHGAAVAAVPLVFTLYLQEFYTLYHSLMFRYFKVWFHFIGALLSFPTVVLMTLLLVRPLGFFGAALAELMGALILLGYAHWYARQVTQRAFRFGEKLGWTMAAYALAALAEILALPVPAKMVLATAALTPYLLVHWQRRGELFEGTAGIPGVPVVSKIEPA